MGRADENEGGISAGWDDIIDMAGVQRNIHSTSGGIRLDKRSAGNIHDNGRDTYRDNNHHDDADVDDASSHDEDRPSSGKNADRSASKNTSTQRWRFNPGQDLAMLQEVSIEAQCPYLKRHGEILSAWEAVAVKLCAHPLFKNFKAPMTARTVRERVDRLRNRKKDEFRMRTGPGYSDIYAAIEKVAEEINDMVRNRRSERDKPLFQKGFRDQDQDQDQNDGLDEEGLLTRLKEITERRDDSDDGGESDDAERRPSKRARSSVAIDPNILVNLLQAQQSYKEKELQLRTKEAELLERKIKVEEAKLEHERTRYEAEKEEKKMLYSVLLKFAEKLDTKKKN
eukprot:CAMPEP_0184693818 /NCGR_PEP_ID=MMETSP0313-20130426/1967_1 /TAXON_ID=2792 /ORGANISM="Porphyridium aerugineum, Strain SAG 1380-2" /LENGTH=339 /DNA_ID=CAMNT_0027151991 /DNA_START=45 /DNA_END=1064 /DNA_ORIENTATION=-